MGKYCTVWSLSVLDVCILRVVTPAAMTVFLSVRRRDAAFTQTALCDDLL